MLVTLYLREKGGRKWLVTGLPFAFMLVLTTYAMVFNEIGFVKKGKWFLSCINGITLVLACWLIVEGIIAFAKPARSAGSLEGAPQVS